MASAVVRGAVMIGCRSEAEDAARGEGAFKMPRGVAHGGVEFEEMKKFKKGVSDEVEFCDATLARFRA